MRNRFLLLLLGVASSLALTVRAQAATVPSSSAAEAVRALPVGPAVSMRLHPRMQTQRQPNADGRVVRPDASQTDPATLTALYGRPDGDFMVGLALNLLPYSENMTFGPAFADVTYPNLSSGGGQFSSEWSYRMGDEAQVQTAVSHDLSLNYPLGLSELPRLTVSAEGAETAVYQLPISSESDAPAFRACGGSPKSFLGGDYGVGNYVASAGMTGYVFEGSTDENPAYCFGTGGEAVYGAEVDAIANRFARPVQPYLLGSVRVALCALDADDDAEFPMTIYRKVGAGDDGSYEKMYTGLCTRKDAKWMIVGGADGTYNVYELRYELFYKTGEDGREIAMGDVLISDEILIEVGGIRSDKVRVFAPFSQAGVTAARESNAAVFLADDMTPGGRRMEWAHDAVEGCHTSHYFTLHVEYPYIHLDDASYEAPGAGGTKTFEVQSYFGAETWRLPADLPAWIDLRTGMTSVGQPLLEVTVQPNDEGTPRECTFSIGGGAEVGGEMVDFGISRSITVTQEARSALSGVDGPAYGVIGTPDGWQLTYPAAASRVSVYDAGGRLLYTQPLTGDCAQLPTAGLAEGVYFLRFADGRVLKAVK